MVDKVSKENRKRFAEEYEAVLLGTRPHKYFEAFFHKESEYDHPLVFRNREFDYIVVSLNGGQRNETILNEGFKPIYPMYNEFLSSYYKKFRNTRRHCPVECE